MFPNDINDANDADDSERLTNPILWSRNETSISFTATKPFRIFRMQYEARYKKEGEDWKRAYFSRKRMRSTTKQVYTFSNLGELRLSIARQNGRPKSINSASLIIRHQNHCSGFPHSTPLDSTHHSIIRQHLTGPNGGG